MTSMMNKALIERIADTIVSYATIPFANPTQPSAPTALDIGTGLEGVLTFSIGQPLVYPRGTYFQVIRSLVSTNAAVGTVTWEGLNNRGSFVAPASFHYYYARAVCNSYFSPYYPNTTGIAALPTGWTTGQIGPNAATEVYQASDPGTDVITLPASQQTAVQYLYVTQTAPVDSIATIKLATSAFKSLANIATDCGIFYALGPAYASVRPSAGAFFLTTSEANYKNQWALSVSSGQSYRVGLEFVGATAANTGAITIRGSTVIAEFIKR